jgi:cyclopropane-fatty-acyl-phospholipid synthase
MLFAGLLYSFTGVAPLFLKVCLGVLTFCWYFRLGYHLQKRVLSEAEDGRYFAMRLAMKEWAQYGFLLFFIVQAGFICLLSLPFWAVAQHTQPHTYFVIAALLIASFALYGVKTTDH